MEDYGYQKKDIQTRPQFSVKRCPSDKKGYPIDITVFEERHGKRMVKMLVECKKPEEKLEAHRNQLQLYMSFSGAQIGVLYNGKDSIYIKRSRIGNDDVFDDIPSIPRANEKLEEIGLYKKSNLEGTHNLKSIFSELRGWIVANGNVTRDDIIASQIILLILCKIYDERFTDNDTNLEFRATITDSDEEIKERIDSLFVATKRKYDDVIEDDEKIQFDGNTLRGIIGRLQRFSLLKCDRDCIADAFEVFIDKAVKEKEGQFFTPRNIVQVIIEAVNPSRRDKVIDSACGSGGFLVEFLRRIKDEIEREGERCGWSASAKQEEVISSAIKNIRGIEKDPFLTKLSKSYMAILGDGKGGIYREDSLEMPKKWDIKTQGEIKFEMFDVCLANPPFGKDIKVEGKEKLEQYNLAYKIDKKGKRTLQKSGNVSSLFLERNLQLIKTGGKIGIILPEPYFALKSYANEIDMMIEGNNIQWIIDLPHNTFRPHNNAKCCAIVIQKGVPQQEYINMAVLEHIGHNHQGKPVYDEIGNLKDDSPQIIKEIRERNQHNDELRSYNGFSKTFKVLASDVIKERVLVPRYYWKSKLAEIEMSAQQKGYMLISMEQLVNEKIITFFSGHGSPKGEYKGLGDVPYIRVKDIVNWQPYIDVTSLIPRSEYEKIFVDSKALKPYDILYVSRGSYRIGSVAMVSPYDGEMLLTREIKVFRMIDKKNKYGLTPQYLCYALSHRFVWEQSKTKIFYEPCLPNIEDRWKNIKIPIPLNSEEYEKLKIKSANIFSSIWNAKKEIQEMREQNDAFLI